MYTDYYKPTAKRGGLYISNSSQELTYPEKTDDITRRH